ncbi:MAG: hypothetical protein J4F45_00805 [Pseudomonadales bacterium]|nr:hypothetical protein [Pseudomonadales bacterium]
MPGCIILLNGSSSPGRFPGTAAGHFDRVYDGCCYDVEIDTAKSTLRECAEAVMATVAEPPSPTAFEQRRAAIGEG